MEPYRSAVAKMPEIMENNPMIVPKYIASPKSMALINDTNTKDMNGKVNDNSNFVMAAIQTEISHLDFAAANSATRPSHRVTHCRRSSARTQIFYEECVARCHLQCP